MAVCLHSRTGALSRDVSWVLLVHITILLHKIWGSERKEAKGKKESKGDENRSRCHHPSRPTARVITFFFLVALVLLASKAQDPVSTSCQIYMTTRLDSTLLIDT